MWKRWLPAALISCVAFGSTNSAQEAGKVDFGRDVQPILRQQCYGCHGPTKQTNRIVACG